MDIKLSRIAYVAENGELSFAKVFDDFEELVAEGREIVADNPATMQKIIDNLNVLNATLSPCGNPDCFELSSDVEWLARNIAIVLQDAIQAGRHFIALFAALESSICEMQFGEGPCFVDNGEVSFFDKNGNKI